MNATSCGEAEPEHGRLVRDKSGDAIKFLIAGLSDYRCERPGSMSRQLDDRLILLKLEKGIDLVQATRVRLVSWEFHR